MGMCDLMCTCAICNPVREDSNLVDDYQEHQADTIRENKHYRMGEIECIDYIRDSLTTLEFQGHCAACVIKYLHRWRFKGGVDDLHKAADYLNWLIDSDGS